jgi:hypothetical protein
LKVVGASVFVRRFTEPLTHRYTFASYDVEQYGYTTMAPRGRRVFYPFQLSFQLPFTGKGLSEVSQGLLPRPARGGAYNYNREETHLPSISLVLFYQITMLYV